MKASAVRRIGSRSFKNTWHIYALIAVALLSFGMNFLLIAKVGYGNAYYAAAVRSMTESFKNFFYVSFDPGGFVSVDKPPLGLWVQALFVLVLGYHGWVMLLPQALAAAGAAVMMYVLTAKYFGRPAGLLAALVFALTPAVVVAARNNTMDAQLVLVLLVSARFLFKSIETSKRRYLFLAAVFVGLGFNIKMLEAYMLLPAAVLVYLLFDRNTLLKRLTAGIVGLVLMLAVSSAWVLAVDLTPADTRPYVGSSSDNTVTQLIIGHNGLERLYGSGGGTGALLGKARASQPSKPAPAGGRQTGPQLASGRTAARDGDLSLNKNALNPSFSVMRWVRLNGPTGGGGNDIGTPGALRLWNSGLYGQITWLLILALFCVLVKIGKPGRKSLTVQNAAIVFWLVWLGTVSGFFSFASFWHRYYLCMLAPGIAGLAGIGLPALVRAFRDRKGWKQFLLPAALIATAVPAIVYVWGYAELRAWLAPLLLAASAASLMLMALHYIKLKKLILYAASALMLLALLAGPFYWSLTAVLYVPQNSTLPYAGPELRLKPNSAMTRNQEVLTTGDSGTVALEQYLVAHYRQGSYLVVSQRADDVAQFIVDTGLPAVAYGGFLGSDNTLTLDRLKALVAEGKITYFLITGQSGGLNNSIEAYVRQHAALVSPREYLPGATLKSGVTSGPNGIGGDALYLFG